MRLLAAIPALVLAACGGPPLLYTSPLSALTSASLFDPISVPVATFDNPLAAAQYFSRYNPSDDGANVMELYSQPVTRPNSLTMIFSVEGYADDSVQGEQWRIELDRVGGGWRVVSAGKRVKCYRSENAGNWQQGLCP